MSYQSEYNQRQKQKGWIRINLVLPPEDIAALGRIMAERGVSRQEAARLAIRAGSQFTDATT